MAQVNAGRVRFIGRGEYDNSTQYYTFDLVNYNGNSYFAKSNTMGNLPTNSTYWQLVAEKGNIGPAGPTGNGIDHISLTSQSGATKVYTIYYTDGTTSEYTVQDGEVTQEVFDEEVERLKMVYNAMPKVTGEGTSVTLNDTVYAPMKVELSPSELEQRNLPNDYTEVEYIESSGTQYIDTGVKLSSNHGFDIKFLTNNDLSVTTGYGCIFGERNSSGNQDYQLTTFGASPYVGTLRWGYASGAGVAWADITLNTVQQCSLKNSIYTSPNGTTVNVSSSATASSYNCYLFGLNNGTSGFSQSGNGCRIYYCKFYDGNNLIRNFIPCYRNSDNEIGMYDLVNDVFYTNQGTGTFTKGNDITLSPENPQDIHTVSGENNAYIQNNNYFDGELELGSFNSSGEKIDSNVHIRSKNFIPVQPNTTYRFSENNTGIALYIHQYDKTYNFLQRSLSNTQQTFTTREDCYYITFRNYDENPDTSLKIMMSKGSNIQPYVQGKIQSLPLSLGDLEYCKIGDYEDLFFKNVVGSTYYDSTLELDKWYLKKNVGKVVFDGSEDEGWTSYGNTGVSNKRFITNITDRKIGTIYNQYPCLSNRFVQKENSLDNSIALTANNTAVWVSSTQIENLSTAEFKEWLNINNTIVYYILTTPTYTLLSDTLQTQLDNIQKAISYQDQTNVSQENDDLPFVIKLSAIRDLSGIFEEI